MSYADAIAQVSGIQAQIASLQTAFVPATSATTSAASPPLATAGSVSAGGSMNSFSAQLASAMAPSAQPTALSSSPTATATTLPARASTMLTSDQQQFASRLAADTGLDPGVVSAWVLAEESGSAAQQRQGASNNDWLNIGYTGAGTYGAADSVWSDPVSAADATAGWLRGQNTIPGYGTASSGIQSILATAGQPPAAQIQALQTSGWAGSGYPDLPGLYSQVAE